MKNEVKIVLAFLMAACLITETGAIMPARQVFAAEEESVKPVRPVITAKVMESGNDVKITVDRTVNADGYRVYMKGPGESSYKRVKSIAKNGTAKRSYTRQALENGIYYFKVKAYRKVDGKKVFSSYSKVAKVEIDLHFGDEEEKYADITFKNGYAYFGSYPQTKVTDSAIITALKNTPGSDDPNGIEYKGKKYIYTENGKYWCQEEQLEWIILEGSATSDTVTLMSNRILLECGYSDWSGFEAGGSWKDSFVRSHLNEYRGSFKSIWTFAFFGLAFPGNVERVLIEQSYNGCTDKVLLPSKEQLSKLTAAQRVRKASDLAKKADSHGYWCIDSDGKGNITLVKSNGEFTTNKAYLQDGQGYVPVIRVDLKKCNVYTE